MSKRVIAKFERASAIVGTIFFAFFAVIAVLAHEFSNREVCVFVALAIAFAFGWFELSKSK